VGAALNGFIFVFYLLFLRESYERYVPRSFNRYSHRALVFGTVACYAAG